jgi:protein-tyrosine phosphatase
LQSFIKGAVENADSKVLVHCNAGVSRSASLVIAYFIREKKLGFQEALNLVKSKRPQIFPNTGFMD